MPFACMSVLLSFSLLQVTLTQSFLGSTSVKAIQVPLGRRKHIFSFGPPLKTYVDFASCVWKTILKIILPRGTG
eukprot:234364-Amphidinium_carterae.1